MNNYLNILIKLLIFLIFLLLLLMALVFAKIVNFDFANFIDNKSIENPKKDSDDFSDDRTKKINNSINQREERIKALKEVGKKLGG